MRNRKNLLLKYIIASCFVFLSGFESVLASNLTIGDNEILVREGDDVQQKFDDAEDDSTLVFDIGTYTLNLNINRPINFRGISTSHVILKGDGSNPIFQINSSQTTIQNFTFLAAAVAITSAASTVTLTNNIFSSGENSTVVISDNNSILTINNNVFHQINEAVQVDLIVDVEIKNNIFSQPTNVNRLFFNVNNSGIDYNCFDEEALPYTNFGSNRYSASLGLVDVENNDFHLSVEGSLCKESGSGGIDMGAYGGVGADKHAFPVADVNIEVDSADPLDKSVTVSWNKNNDYRIDGYKVYYSTESMKDFGFDAERESLSTKLLESLETTILVDDLIETLAPEQPTLLSVQPISSGKLVVKWNKVSDATAYKIYYQLAGSVANSITVDNLDRSTLTGLVDGGDYTVWLEAINQYKYYFQVVPYIDAVNDAGNSILVEGLFINAEKEYVRTDKDKTSDKSESITASPESVVPYPALPNEGCFIATAAFGFYSHSQVQILRDFRDEYLLKTEYGVAFVRWYYHYGPNAAVFINENAYFKPLVRVALYPLILVAEALSYSVFVFFGLLFFYVLLLVLVAKFVFNLFKNYFLNTKEQFEC